MRGTIQKEVSILALLAAIASLYLVAFVVPRTPVYQGDCSPIFLLEAMRMAEGQVIYRDFFEPVLPGTQYLFLGMIKLFGVQSWIPSAMFVLLGALLAWAGAAVSRHVMPRGPSLLPSVLFLAFTYVTEPDPTHHWYSTLAVMLALTLLIERRTPPRLALAGALFGLATLFTQTVGPAAALGSAVFLLWECRTKNQASREFVKRLLILLVPLVAVATIGVAYLVARAGLSGFTYCTIVFPSKFFRLWYWNTPQVYLAESEMPLFSSLLLELPAVCIWFFVHFLVPFIYLIFLVRMFRQAKTHPLEPWDKLTLLTTVGLFEFLAVAYSPSWLRLCSVAFPAIIVFVWLVKSSRRSLLTVTNLLWVISLTVLAAQAVNVQLAERRWLSSPAGPIAILDADRYEKYKWVQERTRPGEYLLQASDVDLYYPFKLRNPTEVPFLTASEYTRPEQVQQVITSLERRRVRFVLWSVWLDVPNHLPFNKSTLEPLRGYLHSRYHLKRGFGGPGYEEVWERNP
jgi:hypothetical protein